MMKFAPSAFLDIETGIKNSARCKPWEQLFLICWKNSEFPNDDKNKANKLPWRGPALAYETSRRLYFLSVAQR